MLKYCVEKWDKNKGKLEKDIRDNLKEYNDYGYKNLVEKIVEIIFNDEEAKDNYELYDVKKITEINNGDYQGTLLYLIPKDTYQPSEYDYLMTCVNYGSCSGCDTLQSIQMWYYDDEEIENTQKEQFITDMMKLCLDLVQNIIKPYNYGWRNDDRFNTIEENDESL